LLSRLDDLSHLVPVAEGSIRERILK